MEKLRDATLVFLIKRDTNKTISHICLAMKKRGFGEGRWNGVGGKVGDKIVETVREAAIRETHEEIGVHVSDLKKVAELSFYFPHNPTWDQLVHVYLAEHWDGKPEESEEMRPQWFAVTNIPFDAMWPDDMFWLPQMLAGKSLEARFSFGEHDVVLEQTIAPHQQFTD